MSKKPKLRTWWRKNVTVKHRDYGVGVITNFARCPKGTANVYFYGGDCVRNDIPRGALCRH